MLITIKAPRTRNIKTHVDCDIEMPDGVVIPFTAMPGDREGAEIYKRAIRGEFGEIAVAPEADCYWHKGKWVVLPLSETTAVVEASARKTGLLKRASEAIAILLDAYELGMTTEEEERTLQAWRKYRVLVSRVDVMKPAIEWPEVPNVA